MAAPLRIGVLGAAAIAPNAIVRPAVRSSRATVFGIAARDPDRLAVAARELASATGGMIVPFMVSTAILSLASLSPE